MSVPSTKARVLAAGLLVASLALAGCSGSSGSPKPEAMPNVVGTWLGGSARMATEDGSVQTSNNETLIIDKQDGKLVWGSFIYDDGVTGNSTRTVVTGTLLDGGKGIVLTEPAAISQGELSGNTMTLVTTFTAGGPNHSAFQLTYTKK
jgi:hypothetical protein